MDAKKVLNTFQFDVKGEPESIYPFSPVYKVNKGEMWYIVKKTRSPMEKAISIVNFIKRLHKNGVPIVTPVQMEVDNPQQIDDLIWVVYPYIDGTTYSGKDLEIYEAGRLLGQIHSLSSTNNDEGLSTYNEFGFKEQEIANDLKKIKGYADHRGITLDDDLLSKQMFSIIDQQASLKSLILPSVATPNDYKANNLIYNENNKPFLIDPDNAVFLPRIYDLALTLLLFHNELDTAPGPMFDKRQWSLFKKGYFQFVELTDIEKETWHDVLMHVFLDEVIWLMAEFEEDWDVPKQIQLYNSLLSLINNMDSYLLD
jgi:Ser/Thr protein kinase RdoA (MazF antagonist)